MNFIADTEIPNNPYEYVGLLRSKGILAKHNSEFQKAPHSHLNKKGVWVILDSQYADAVALMSDGFHKVSNPLTEEEMLQLEADAKNLLLNQSSKFFSLIAKVIFYTSLSGFMVYVGYQIVNSI